VTAASFAVTDQCHAHLFRRGHDVVPEIRLQSRTKVTTGSLDSQALVQQPRKALPVGRGLRILLGFVVIVYTVPVYFQVPMRLAVGGWLLVLGLIGIYSLIHIVVSRRIVAFGPISVPRHHFPLQGSAGSGFKPRSVAGWSSTPVEQGRRDPQTAEGSRRETDVDGCRSGTACPGNCHWCKKSETRHRSGLAVRR